MNREIYTHGYAEQHQRLHSGRTAARDAAFFLPFLRSNMRLLDCGCGPGSITIGLAQAVPQGEVVALDVAPVQLDHARALAEANSVPNIRFELADIYQLPYPDASFDAAFAHNVLEHLRDPVLALREIRRVLRTGGLVGIRDDDWSAYLLEPTSPLREEAIELILRVVAQNGGDFRSARFHARRLREAGFVSVQDVATAGGNGTSEPVGQISDVLACQLEDERFASVAVGQGWADTHKLAAMADDLRRWGQSPDAYVAFFKCAALGFVPEVEIDSRP